jgi:hypothetical protein
MSMTGVLSMRARCHSSFDATSLRRLSLALALLSCGGLVSCAGLVSSGSNSARQLSISLNATDVSVQVSHSTSFTATVSNDPSNLGVSWSLSGSGCSGSTCGTLTNVTTTSVTYTASATAPSPATVTLKATSLADNSKWASATVTITTPPAAISVTVNPTSASVQVSQSTSFTATVQNDSANKGATWTISGTGCSGAACGTLTNVTTTSVTYNAPATAPSPATVTLQATSIADSTKSATATVTITTLPPPISVSVNPTSASVQVSQSTGFTATVQNDSAKKGANWVLSGTGCTGAACGTLTNVTTTSVTYNAPASVPSPATVTLQATSIADSTKSATATVAITTLPPPISVSVNPASASVQVSQFTSFTATVQNDSLNKGVSWSVFGSGCSGAACGTLTNVTTTSVTYNAPATAPSPATVTLQATSVADNTKSVSAIIAITTPPPPISVTVNPTSVSVQVSQSASFTATVQNDSANKGVSWSLSGTGCSGAACGTLTNVTTTSVTYNAPATVPSPATVTLQATSIADSTKSAAATVTITTLPPPISVSVNPISASVQVSQSTGFTATVQNDSAKKGANWVLSGTGCTGAACGTLTNVTTTSVTYNAPVTAPSPASVTLQATSIADNTKSASAIITITTPPPPISVTANPTSALVQVSQSTGFSATVQNDSANKGVSWSVFGSGCSGAACGTLTNVTTTSVTYNAPATAPSPATVTLQATSVADNTKSASASITITTPPPPISVTVNPTSASVQISQSTGFSATVQNDSGNKGVSWSLSGTGCSGAACGTLTNVTTTSVTYNAPATAPSPATVTLQATSIADNTKSASASITITTPPPPISVTVNPTSASVQVSQSTGFSGTVQNDSANKGVSWSLSGTGCTGAACGTLTNVTTTSVTYNAPATAPSPATVTLQATSIADNTKSASVIITISSATATVTISPRRGSLTFTQTLQLQTNLPSSSVTWSVDGFTGGNATVGTITSSGLFTPGTAAGAHSITVTANGDASNNATAVIAVTDFAGVPTYHTDNARTGQNVQEYALTPSTVNSTQFGLQFTQAIDGWAYAQPLWVPSVAVAGKGTHNVVFVATMNNSVYAFDADTKQTALWHVSLTPAGEATATPSQVNDTNILVNIGIIGTPVIDSSTGTLYVVAKTCDAATCTTFHQRLHALDITTGNEKTGSPVDIVASVAGVGIASSGGTVAFSPLHHMQRPGLLLSNGVVYIGLGSHDDNDPYHGWVLGYDARTLQQTMVYCTTPDATEGSIWMSGGGLASDPSGNIYFITANGSFDANAGGRDYGDSIVKLSPGGTVLDYFSPDNEADLSTRDVDLGAAGPVILPDQTGAHVHEVLGGGKGGIWYLLDRDNMGHFDPVNDSQIVQSVTIVNTSGGVFTGMFDSPAYWNGNLYVSAVNDVLKAYSLSAGLLSFSPTSTSNVGNFSFPSPTPAVSANGTSNGVVWAMSSAGSTLHAFDALNLATELYNSGQAAGNRDRTGQGVKFSVPTVANGKVYVGTQTELDVFGLFP